MFSKLHILYCALLKKWIHWPKVNEVFEIRIFKCFRHGNKLWSIMLSFRTYFKLSSGQKIGSTVYNLLNLMTTINWPLSWTWLSNSKSEISSTVLNFVCSLILIFETGKITYCKTGSVLKQFWIRTSDCFSYHVIDIICK